MSQTAFESISVKTFSTTLISKEKKVKFEQHKRQFEFNEKKRQCIFFAKTTQHSRTNNEPKNNTIKSWFLTVLSRTSLINFYRKIYEKKKSKLMKIFVFYFAKLKKETKIQHKFMEHFKKCKFDSTSPKNLKSRVLQKSKKKEMIKIKIERFVLIVVDDVK